jgi:hypothetical protein
MQFKTRSEVALYVWDYFFLANLPRPGDEKIWAAISRATCRIHESEQYLDHPPTPADVRIRHARRVRNAARVALRNIGRLSAEPARWAIDGLAELEAFANDLIQTLARRDVVLH